MGNALASGIHKARIAVGRASNKFLADLCTIEVDDLVEQGAGHTVGPVQKATNVPCSHKQISGGGVTIHDGDTEVTKTHVLQLPYTDANMLIDRHYRIRVAPNGFNPELVYEQPVIKKDSNSPLIIVFAVLSEGYRQPGVS